MTIGVAEPDERAIAGKFLLLLGGCRGVPFIRAGRPHLSRDLAQARQLDKYFAEPTQDYERTLAARSRGDLLVFRATELGSNADGTFQVSFPVSRERP